jgi:HEPN domain-containing protein
MTSQPVLGPVEARARWDARGTRLALAESYQVKATARLRVLGVLGGSAARSDTVCEAQETVEPALKRMLRQVGVEPPMVHDVGAALDEHASRFAPGAQADLPRLRAIAAWLRMERGFAFCGDIDFIPTEGYSEADAARGEGDGRFEVGVASSVIGARNTTSTGPGRRGAIVTRSGSPRAVLS